jgi:pyrroloquinoline quinone biosynthesis protein B
MRTQASIAVTVDHVRWLIVNASPDLRQQILATPELHPVRSGPLRNSPIAAVILTNADVDAIAGLLSLRERQPFTLYATERVHEILKANPIFDVLDSAVVKRENISLKTPFTIPELGIQVEAFAVPAKVALYLEASEGIEIGQRTSDVIGLKMRQSGVGRTAVYIPSAALIDQELVADIEGSAVLFFDGTLYRDDELIRSGLGDKTGKRMGHVSVSGPAGAIDGLASVALGRRIFTHINTSNPMLIAGSEEAKSVEAAGWEVAFDGMVVEV